MASPWTSRPRARCRSTIAGLPPGSLSSLNALLEEVERRRGRELRVETADAPQESGPTGFWLATAKRDRIVVSSGVSTAHRRHIILHEIGHILMEHSRECATDVMVDSGQTPLITGVSEDLINLIFNRRVYDTRYETEAEIFATMAGVRLLHSPPVKTGEVAETVQRLTESFRFR